MNITGIIGWPLLHTLSPVMHRAAFDYIGLDIAFEVWPTPLDKIHGRLERIRQSDCIGVCVTIPHKENVMRFLDDFDASVLGISSVNWIVNQNGKLKGYNTDGEGFIKALQEGMKYSPRNRRALVIGAGGAARAVVFALREAGCASITVANRTLDRAERLRDSLMTDDMPIYVIDSSSSMLEKATASADIIVNASSIGMAGGSAAGISPILSEWISKTTIGYDIVYTPTVTPFIKAFREAGAYVDNGLSMLLQQAAIGFRLLTGEVAPIEVMRRSLQEASI